MAKEQEFAKELENLLNKYNREAGSDTPDFILAAFLNRILLVFNMAIRDRERWYERKVPGDPIEVMISDVFAQTVPTEPPSKFCSVCGDELHGTQDGACALTELSNAEAIARLSKAVGIVQTKLQPPGSPPPGDELVLLNWICDTTLARIRGLEEDLNIKPR